MARQEDAIPAPRDYRNIWVLNTANPIKGLTWWWWWWIFFIRDPDNDRRTKQLMILWSTKYTDHVRVMDHDWSCSNPPVWNGDTLEFNGMTASWWYDGKRMEDTQVLVESDFRVERRGGSGELRPLLEADYGFSGSPKEYRVNIVDDRNDFRFTMRPWNDYMSRQRFNESHYTRKYSYNIMKIYGMRLGGTVNGDPVEGSAYFQRVTVNAPAPPWYWGVLHFEDGSYLDYFQPYVGPQIFRTTDSARSMLDWGDIRLNRSIQFYSAERDREYRFRTRECSIRHGAGPDGLPVFDVRGRGADGEIHLRWSAYSRAYWRFQQRRRLGFSSILYYNEYPAEVNEFSFRGSDGTVVKGGDLGWMTGNMEHSWGKLI